MGVEIVKLVRIDVSIIGARQNYVASLRATQFIFLSENQRTIT